MQHRHPTSFQCSTMASKVKKKRATEQFILFDPPHRKRRVFCFVGPTIYGPKTVHFFCQLLFAGREDGFPPFSAYDIIIFNEQSCTKNTHLRYAQYHTNIYYGTMLIKQFS